MPTSWPWRWSDLSTGHDLDDDDDGDNLDDDEVDEKKWTECWRHLSVQLLTHFWLHKISYKLHQSIHLIYLQL